MLILTNNRSSPKLLRSPEFGKAAAKPRQAHQRRIPAQTQGLTPAMHSRGTRLELYVLRHGEAGKSLAALVRDRKRSLTEQGKEEVQVAAKSISALDVKFDHIISSPLSRAAETAELVAKF